MPELRYKFQKFLRKYIWAHKMNFQKGKIDKKGNYEKKKKRGMVWEEETLR